MSRSSTKWMEIATAQKVRPIWAKEIKDVLMRAKVNDIVAARDRDSFSEPWRRVLLKKVSKTTWLLLDENGKALDEPDCPCGERSSGRRRRARRGTRTTVVRSMVVRSTAVRSTAARSTAARSTAVRSTAAHARRRCTLDGGMLEPRQRHSCRRMEFFSCFTDLLQSPSLLDAAVITRHGGVE